MRRKKTLPELIADVKITINKIDFWISRIDSRVKNLEQLSLSNIGRFPYLSKEYIKEADVNKNIVSKLFQLKVILEILEIRLETVLILGELRGYLAPVLEAVKIIKKDIGMSIEFTPLIDEILDSLIPIINIDKSFIPNISEEANKILLESENIAKQEVDKKYKVSQASI
ncbi:cell division protein CdvB3 [Stygiolobus caldivivus]|uniref:Uncharacterized protein n=1 Tax=Stygiolobus caldivivus TaxID=2824673 RepID=A0A8D5ZK60_9CREN|nr:cell division protein CdvB3 [Stygiolobus caldivivus]BCU71386.1 hypothetical protein KN1_26830 [Stygiolobus caldivivus]